MRKSGKQASHLLAGAPSPRRTFIRDAGIGLLAFVAGGFSNFFLRRTFVSDAVGAFVVCTTLALIVVVQFTHLERAFDGEARVDWRLVPAGVLILFALWMLAAIALACSTRRDGRVLESVQSFEQQLGEAWYRIYYDTRALVVVFPDLEPGDVVELRRPDPCRVDGDDPRGLVVFDLGAVNLE